MHFENLPTNFKNTRMTDTRFGLTEEILSKLKSVFAQYALLETVVIYGSRAKGNYKKGSDIDLTIIGDKLTFEDFLKIQTDIDDLLLPYKVDLSLFKQIANEALREHIMRCGVEIFKKNSTE